jgi:hypothetical protein
LDLLLKEFEINILRHASLSGFIRNTIVGWMHMVNRVYLSCIETIPKTKLQCIQCAIK